MKYIIKNSPNEIILKLNSTPVNTFSGDYLFSCKHVQTSQTLTLVLTDESTNKDNYQKFTISSGDSNNFLLGQYEVNIYDATASTVLITTEYFLAKSTTANDNIYFMANADTAYVYESTSTSIPNIPVALTAVLQPSGDEIVLQWQAGSTNTDAFDLWRKTNSGAYININADIQSFIYYDQYLGLNTTYTYKLRARNTIGFSNFTAEVSAVTSTTGTTGGTNIVLIGSGATNTTYVSGNTWIIDSPIGDITIIGSGNTTVAQSGTSYVIYSPTGGTSGSYVPLSAFTYYTGTTAPLTYLAISGLSGYWNSGQTIAYVNSVTSGLTSSWSGLTGQPVDNSDLVSLLLGYSLTGHNHTGVYSPVSHLHTGVYSPTGHTHVIANVSGLQTALDSKSNTGHTHAYNTLTGLPTLFTGNTFTASGITVITKVGDNVNIYVPPDAISAVTWTNVTNKPQWLSGTTLSAFQTGHTHSQYLTGITGYVTTVEFTGLTNSFDTHTGNTTIHYPQSGISITETQVQGLVGKYSLSGHNHNTLYSVLGHTHVISGVTGLQSALDGKSGTGHTHTGVYAPVVHTHAYSAITNTPDLNAYALSGHTHVTLTGLTINESQVNGLVGDLAAKSNTGHTHAYNTLTGLPTLFTGNTFVESGATQITQVGNVVTIYTNPTGVTTTLVGSGNTTVNNVSGNTWVVYSPTGGTGGAYLPLSGGTTTGKVKLESPLSDYSKFISTGNTSLGIVGGSGYEKDIVFFTKTGTTEMARWVFNVNSTAETGGNAGSDFVIKARNDAGGILSSPISITRSTGLVGLNKGFSLSGTTITATAAQINGLATPTDILSNVSDGEMLVRSGNTIQGEPAMHFMRTTANQTINGGAQTYVDITNLSFPVVSGTSYAFYFYVTFRSAATGTGWKAGVNCPTGDLDFWHDGQTIANYSAGQATHTRRHAIDRDDMTQLTSTITANVNLTSRIEGRYLCTQNGTFAARFANELAADTNLVIQKGSWGWWA